MTASKPAQAPQPTQDAKASFPATDPRDALLKPMDPNKTPEQNYMDWLLSPSDPNDKFVP